MNGSPWTRSEIDGAFSLLGAGSSVDEVAVIIGRSPAAVASKVAKLSVPVAR